MDRKVMIALVIAVAAVVTVGAVAVTLLVDDEESGSVYYLRIAPANMAVGLQGGSIDGYIAWEPFVSEAIVGGTGEVLLWSHDIMPNHPCCVVAVSNDFASGPDGEELTLRFLKSHIEATEWMISALSSTGSGGDYDLLITLATEFTDRSAAVVEEAFQHLTFTYAVDDTFTSSLETFVNMYVDLNQTTLDEIQDRGYDSVEELVDVYVNETYIDAADAILPSATVLNEGDPIRLGYLLGDLHQLAQYVAADERVTGTGMSLFETYGVEVAPADGAPYANGGVVMDSFAAGLVDIGYLGAPPALIKHIKAGVDITIAAQANIEGSGLVVEAGSGIGDVSDLENLTIATPGETTIQHLLLKIALDREGLKLVLKPS